MMKSFFKKLAFVMALAMVVSAMAPAATAKAAEAKTVSICVQNDNYIERPTYDELTEGDAAKDFCFAGAPDWKNYKWTWSSDNEAVATVDNTGLVTPVAAGEATITVKGGDVYTGTMKLTVKSKEVAKTFKVEQKTANTAVITFDDATAVTKDITVVKVISTLAGDKYQPYVLNAGKTTQAGNTVTIEPWVPFGTATYLVTANGVTQKLETSVGTPAEAKLEYKEPYTFAEVRKAAAATLTVTDAKGVVVTDYTAYYELVEAKPVGYAYVDAAKGDLYFYVDNAEAKVKVTIRYTENNVAKEFSIEETFKASKKPVVTLNNYIDTVAVITQASVLKDGVIDTAKADKINWTSSQIKIDDGYAQVVGLIQESDGDSFSINKWSVGTAKENKTQLDNCDNPANYKFTYESTDTSKVIVDATTGTLVGVNTTEVGNPVYVLVTLHKKVNSAWQKVGIVAVAPVDVQAKKAAERVSLGTDNMAVLLTDGAHTSKEVTPKTYNQYGEEMADTIKSVTTTFNNKTYSIDSAKNQTKFTVDGALVNNFFNSDSSQPKSTYFVFKVEMNSGKTTEFYLTLKEVTEDNKANKEFKLDLTSAVVKHDKLAEKVAIGVNSLVLGEKFDSAPFYYGKMDSSVITPEDKGALYVIVRDPSGNVITPATSGAVVPNNKWEANALKTSTGKLETLAVGDYWVELYKVIDVIVDEENERTIIVDTMIDRQKYSVDNQLPNAATDITFDLSKKLTVVNGTTYLAEGAVTFKVNGALCKGIVDTNFTKIDVNAVTVGNSDKVFVYSVKVQYKVGTGYVEVEVPVNKTYDVQR